METGKEKKRQLMRLLENFSTIDHVDRSWLWIKWNHKKSERIALNNERNNSINIKYPPLLQINDTKPNNNK